MTEDLSDNAKYLCPYCSATYSGFDTLKTHVLSEHSGEELPQPDGLVNLVINTKKQLVLVQPEWTLYYLLHDKLGLIGSKQFCDRGACGSCTVIMNGRAILSCMALAIECDGRTVETIEGIADAEHPLIENYAEHHAMQCGYCTPGFLVTAKALLDKNPDPTEDEIREALAGNLCRCGTYPQHPIAVLETVRQIREENIDA